MNLDDKTHIWKKFTALIFDYLRANEDTAVPVVNYKSADELKEILNLNVNLDGVEVDALFKEIERYLKYSVRTGHPQFNNQLYGGFNFQALLAEIVTFVSNTSMATYEIAPVATLVEKKLIELINNRIGYYQGGGIMLTGGSNANMMAIHCARNNHSANVRQAGNAGHKFCVFVSEEAHYSFKKAVVLMGIGLDNLILVRSDQNGKMLPEDLENKIIEAIKNGKAPIMIASTCGTTVKGAFDPIEKNQNIADKYKLWHHIDGAWGGAALFSEKTSHFLKGADRADSFTFDAHKLFGTGLVTSFFLTRNDRVLRSVNDGGGSEYLFHTYENAAYDSGPESVQCGRKVDSLKLWLMWKSLGDKGLSDRIDTQIQKMKYFKELINEHPRLQLTSEPEYLNVCFQILPPDLSIDINKFNLELRYKMIKMGKFMVNYSTDTDGKVFFRMVFCNNMTTKNDLRYFVDELIKMAL